MPGMKNLYWSMYVVISFIECCAYASGVTTCKSLCYVYICSYNDHSIYLHISTHLSNQNCFLEQKCPCIILYVLALRYRYNVW